MRQNIHPEYHPVVFMDSTTGFKFLSGSTKIQKKPLNGKTATHTQLYVLKSLLIHIHSILDVKNSHKQMAQWTVSTRNTVSKTPTQRNNKMADLLAFRGDPGHRMLSFFTFDHTF